VELVVPVWAVLLPVGVVRVNVTLAPEAGLPPFITVAVIGIVLRSAKLEAGTATVTVIAGALMTVTLPVPEPLNVLLDAFASTG